MSNKTVAAAIGAFGASLKSKLSNASISGAPEDQLRAPLETLMRNLAEIAGRPEGWINLVGETSLSDLKTRPDYAVLGNNALIGFIEVKAPGKGCDPRRFTDEHDRRQWAKLKSLPNLLYTDGNGFSLWRNGEPAGKIIQLDGDVTASGKKLSAPLTLLPLISDFLTWEPHPPRTVKELAETAARLCRLLRDEVSEALAVGNPGLGALASEWRGLLFPQASDAEFADGYAQAVTFGMLVARFRSIDLSHGVEQAALELRKANSLIGTALRLLTDNGDVLTALETALKTLIRVLDVVDWPKLSKGSADAWIYFYEDFLAVYDNTLRKRTGSYYTPPQVVDAMVRLVDEALRDPALFGLPLGLASSEVTVADPAMGTGAYLLGTLRRIAETVEADLGPGAVPGAVASAASRLIGFEMQFGPFAVAQLRLIAEVQALMSLKDGAGGNLPTLRLFVTDTLGDPYAAQTQFSAMTAPIGESRKQANAIKRDERITVVIGNPPYKEKARGRGGWIEAGSPSRVAPMAWWTPPPAWGVSAHSKHLKNLYVFFWRWAALKVFGSGWQDATGEPEPERAGIVCFITVAGFLNGPGFQKLREELRRDCSDIWVIDCSPEGHQPDVPTRIFQGVQQPVCIVLGVRLKGKDRTKPARLHFRALPEGRREAKFEVLKKLALGDGAWTEGESGLRSPLLPNRQGSWASFLPLPEVFDFAITGVQTHRMWVIAPDVSTLDARWSALKAEKDPVHKAAKFRLSVGRDPHRIVTTDLGIYVTRRISVADDASSLVEPIRYSFRSFDRQWLPPDHRLIHRGRPELWAMYSDRQVHLTALDAASPSNGPAVTLTSLMPDGDHYHGRGGRVFPLWRDAAATIPNVKPKLLTQLSTLYGVTVPPEDVMAYIAALLAHPAYTARFQADLVRPGLRVPMTADATLFREAAALGREIVWLHCYGERFADPAAGRRAAPPRLPKGEGPVIPAGGGIPGAPEPLPETMTYDPATKRLSIGKGFIDNVPKAVWDYEVSGKNTLRQWFSYRRRDRTRPIIGDRRPPSPLDAIQPDHWFDEYTVDLMNLLHVLGRLVKLEPAQAALLERICSGALIPASAITEPETEDV